MNHLKYLEFQRMMKELQFVESDYNYQSEIVKISDNEFLKSVDFILDQYPELKELYYRKQNDNYSLIESLNNKIDVTNNVSIEKIPESKKVYYDIAKATHPDKIKNDRLNEFYLEATEAYEQNDIVTLYKLCSELNIEFEFTDDFIEKLKNKINSFKDRVSFLEKTFTFKWIKSSDDQEKKKIIVEFIKSKVS